MESKSSCSKPPLSNAFNSYNALSTHSRRPGKIKGHGMHMRSHSLPYCTRQVQRSKMMLYQLKKEGVMGKFHSRNKNCSDFDKGLKTHESHTSHVQIDS